ncbi:MAG TPA: hypothetical protein VMT03_07215 [Polyangia bacterium]|nr:hypothetical protein [Polyangia bacterium]
MSINTSPGITIWIWLLRAIVVCNLAFLVSIGRRLIEEVRPDVPEKAGRYRRRLFLLSCLFVLGCAFRSLWPRADVQRIVIFDGWWSTVMIGRSVATVAEMAFMAQWALVLREGAPPGTRDLGWYVGRFLVPMIGVAEAFSWYAVLTTNFLGNVLEQSTWTLASALVVASVLKRAAPTWRSFAQATAGMIIPYIVFMSVSDVPMYFRRWRADQARARQYLSLPQGIRDASSRTVLTRQWDLWHDEIAWMSLYFSAGVWVSLWLVRSSPEPVSALSRNEQKSHSKFAS